MTIAPYLLLNTDDPLLGEDITLDGQTVRALVVKLVYGPPGSIEGEVSAEQPLPVTGGGGGGSGLVVNRASVTDHSGTITAGGTAQQVLAADTNRVYLFFQNVSGHSMWIDFGVTAVEAPPAILLNPNDAFVFEGTFIYTGTLSVISANTSDPFICKAGSQASSIVNSGPLTDFSGTITTGGASQQVIAANPIRKYLLVYNPGSENIYVNFGGAADLGVTSIAVVPGGQFHLENTFICTQSVNIIAASTDDPFVVKEG